MPFSVAPERWRRSRAREQLAALTRLDVPWATATSGRMETAAALIEIPGVDPIKVPVVTRHQARHAKPEPDLFVILVRRPGARIHGSAIIGDGVWDRVAARCPRSLGIELLSGALASNGSRGRTFIGSTNIWPTCRCIWTKSA